MYALTITPVVLGDTYELVLDDNVTYDVVFSYNSIGKFYIANISVSGVLLIRRKVVSGVDIFAGRAVNRVYAEDASLIETGETRFILE